MNKEERLAGADPALDSEPFPAPVPAPRARRKRANREDLPAESDAADERPRSWPSDPVEPLAKKKVLDPRLRPAPLPEIQYDGTNTEEMLHGLIAECHFLMRHVTLPTMCLSRESSIRREFLNSAMELARTGAHVAETIGHLRHGSVKEILQRHEVVHGPAPARKAARR
jgi:hypothetical protein